MERNGSCVVIAMRNGENRVSNEFIKRFHEALDTVEE